jgi:Rrf2 family transcriptional regulator, iron-sulfur cluster assembly transcription factor
MRLEVTRRAELAVRAMTALGAGPGRMKAPALAAEIDTTVAFVPQVVRPLVQAGWVRSDPGPTGGYALRVRLADVSVLDVIEAVDGVTNAGRCVVEDKPCQSEAPCTLHHAWSAAREGLTSTLRRMPLSEIGR